MDIDYQIGLDYGDTEDTKHAEQGRRDGRGDRI